MENLGECPKMLTVALTERDAQATLGGLLVLRKFLDSRNSGLDDLVGRLAVTFGMPEILALLGKLPDA